MTFGIIAAMAIEAEQIIAAMENTTAEEWGSIRFHCGNIGVHRVVCAVCGIGKVFAAMCAQTMIVRYAPDVVINTGVGGTLTRRLTVGDIAISTDVVQHDMDTSALGDPVGMISGINRVHLPADCALGEKIAAIAEKSGIRCVLGTIASGDRFVADGGLKHQIVERFDAIACEMEGAAVGQACFVNGVPFAVVRAISDDADGGACEDYPAFAAAAAKKSAQTVITLVREWNGLP